MTKFFFVFIFLISAHSLCAQGDADSLAKEAADSLVVSENEKDFTGPNDTTLVIKKSFDQQQVQKFKDDPAFNYTQPPSVAESLWDRFVSWLMSILESIFKNATGTNWGRVLLYTAGVALLIVIMMMILKVNAFKVFYNGADKGKVGGAGFHENIHEMDFEKLIREAAEKEDYRLGVRLIFLYALKTLSNKHLIDWQAGKTNHDYVEELNARDLKVGLNELSFYFDYAWYGGFVINRDIFSKVQTIFTSWKDKV